MTTYQKIGVSGFLNHNNKVLLVRRAPYDGFMANFWELPGGKVEFGEDPKEALKREFQEEVGLQISVDKPIHLFSYLSDNNNRQTVDITFITTLEGENTDIKLSPEHTEYTWVDKNEVGNYSMSDEMKRCIEAGFNQ